MPGFHRQRFTLRTDTGVSANATKGDTGPSFYGEVVQVRAVYSDTGGADTGLDLQVGIYPETTSSADTGQGDTGLGFLILDVNDIGAAGRTWIPTMHVSSLDGAEDTGRAYAVGAGDRLRVKAIAGNTETDSGEPLNVFVWIKGVY